MAGIWKSATFFGTLGIMLGIGAFLAGEHTNPDHFPVRNVADIVLTWQPTTNTSQYLAASALGLIGYQVLVTLVGLVLGFFKGPQGR